MVDKRGLGGLGGSKPKSRLPTLSEFINPFSLPPGETDQGMKGPTLREVIVPPTTPGRPPGVAPEGWGNYLLDFINPFSAPPGEAEPIGYRPDQVGPYPKTYRNDLPPPPLPEATMPPGWTPPLTLHQRIERGLEAQRQRRSEPPPARRQEPVLRRKKPLRPKARESEA